ncbi:MAG TPA: TrmH family RNA methyltransferase, partial [Candidatus Limnocylindria bacterium]|nr:TrmH family RNA methyltransferase [Candidatus Limnocylindria bacterium]
AGEILALCRGAGIRTEAADKSLRRISGKDNCYAAAVFRKSPRPQDAARNHLTLVSPMDAGNVGTILRTALGLGFTDVALVQPCADPFDPGVVRASMGALFSLRLSEYADFAAYRAAYPDHALFPFMLDGSVPLSEAVNAKKEPFTLVFGNEGSGLPGEFAGMGTPVRIEQGEAVDSLNLAVACGIGMYAFRNV